MSAHDVIESYVHDVALHLPRRQRNDVAFELRALLQEELRDRAEAAGTPPDDAMALALVRAHGRPADIAAQYRPPPTIIDPADARAFLQATVIGLAVIWCAGLLAHLLHPLQPGSPVLVTLGHWWGDTVIRSLWWPGLLVVGFGIAAWMRRRWPRTAAWKPRADQRSNEVRAGMVLAILAAIGGLYVLTEPRLVLDLVFHGRAAPAAYDGLTYTDGFRRLQAPVLFGTVALSIPLLAAVLLHGRWTPALRRVEMLLNLLLCAVMTWVVLSGPVFVAAHSDRFMKGALVVLVVGTLLVTAFQGWRRVRPAPNANVAQAGR